MRIGIFAKTFATTSPAPTVDAVFAAMRANGFERCQYNMACSGLAAMPDAISDVVVADFNVARERHGIAVDALSATYNMIHPDSGLRSQGAAQFEVLARFAKTAKIPLLTLCTGSRDAHDQWAYHPGNQSPEAQRDLLMSMERAIAVAEDYDLLLGIEPEHGNVINTAQAAAALIDELQSNRVRIVLDPANLIADETGTAQHAVIGEAIDLLGEHVVMAHAKDRDASGHVVAAGCGIVDFTYFLAHLKAIGFQGPLVTHGLGADEAADVFHFLKGQIA
jgi:sugar phosphate isomerase/epimerase